MLAPSSVSGTAGKCSAAVSRRGVRNGGHRRILLLFYRTADNSGTFVVIDLVRSEYHRIALDGHVSAKVHHRSVSLLLIRDNNKLSTPYGCLSDGRSCNALLS